MVNQGAGLEVKPDTDPVQTLDDERVDEHFFGSLQVFSQVTCPEQTKSCVVQLETYGLVLLQTDKLFNHIEDVVGYGYLGFSSHVT
jgi:hypothetical protein